MAASKQPAQTINQTILSGQPPGPTRYLNSIHYQFRIATRSHQVPQQYTLLVQDSHPVPPGTSIVHIISSGQPPGPTRYLNSINYQFRVATRCHQVPQLYTLLVQGSHPVPPGTSIVHIISSGQPPGPTRYLNSIHYQSRVATRSHQVPQQYTLLVQGSHPVPPGTSIVYIISSGQPPGPTRYLNSIHYQSKVATWSTRYLNKCINLIFSYLILICVTCLFSYLFCTLVFLVNKNVFSWMDNLLI